MTIAPISSDLGIQTIAILDDSFGELYDRMIPWWEVELAGFKQLTVPQSLHSLAEIVTFIKTKAQGAICTHRLAPRGSSHFYGAELVSALYDMKIPALLVTQYTDIDLHTSLRKWRDKIPVILHLRNAIYGNIRQGLEICASELQGHFSNARIPYQVLLNVINIEDDSNERMVDVTLPYWDHYQVVRFPMSLISKELHASIKRDTWLLADVNVGARACHELYFRNFKLAPASEDVEECLTYCVTSTANG